MPHKRLWIPGPTEVSEKNLMAQAQPMIGHRESSFTKLYTGITDKLKEFFELEESHVIVHTSSGTLWMDITGRNLVRNKALAATCGSFSERMYETLLACGKEVDQYAAEWGTATKPDPIMEHLDESHDALTIVHNETSTGIRNPTTEIGKRLKAEYPETMYIIDSVSALGGDMLLPEKDQADLVFTATQKAFALPPGLSIGIISPAGYERAKTVDNRGSYTDLVGLIDYYKKKGQTPSTPAISLLYALDTQLDDMLEEGHANISKRHEEMAKFTRTWVHKHGMKMFPEEGYESITVSTIANNLEKSIADLNKELATRNLHISNGYGPFKEKNFRIGHMGLWTMSDLKELLWHIEEIWNL
ncbi:MAG: pyridoxal-phosphate-dependent aminotransferase family protein [Candidatus Kariarchaeaceae archaeon]|jgi:aspartate aminotransferase-like enzyme